MVVELDLKVTLHILFFGVILMTHGLLLSILILLVEELIKSMVMKSLPVQDLEILSEHQV